MVNRLERAYSKIFLFFISSNYNISKLKLIHLVLIWNETKHLQIAKFWNFGKTETPWGVSNRSKNDFRTKPPLIFCYNFYKPAILSHLNILKITFGWTHLLPKNSKLKLVFKEADKETRKASFPWDLGLILGQPIWST